MPLRIVPEDSAYKCSKCGHVMKLKKDQMLPPCTKCGGTMEKYEGPVATSQRPDCS